ncbi:Dihydropteroate synthase [Clostridium cavendishii DSM 21758]|uniref:Dihydropteroate synthase n=1 Tax=Clostridium cavendishii DSM 21758 TaxID=1121302 RepID=A0A1M6EVX1_9CLOT|nr:dihydropteroate synthase [Clostridium cavendishii]SHI89644.1 Dihydropteroate synthase [Clostridium cavendishii DSM 21758]
MKIGNTEFNIGERTYVMGILNVTPDSFSDGGKFNVLDKAMEHAFQMINEGVDIIDIGGESTRPNHTKVLEDEEIKRVVPIIKALREKSDIPISIDTYKGKVAEEAILVGANLINDVWGFKKDTYMAKVAAKYGVQCCLMHNRDNTDYDDIIEDMKKDLEESIKIALDAGVKKENIILDPGIGFAKTYEQNLEVLNRLEELNSLGYPILLGTSRKSVIGLTLNLDASERLEGTLATTTLGIMKGCDFVRIHDVLQNKRVCVMTDAMVRR